MLLLTGKRKSALALMRWEEIDDNWFWDAPAGSKNKRLHAIPLPKKATEVLHPRGKTGLVFGDQIRNGYKRKFGKPPGSRTLSFTVCGICWNQN